MLPHYHPVGSAALVQRHEEGEEASRSALACPGAQAEVSADQVATVMWDYFSQLSNNAKEAVEHLQKSELTQQIR